MSSKRQQRERKNDDRQPRPRRSLLRRSRDVGGMRFGLPVVILMALAFILWLIFDVGGLRF
jgi:hypothetical protein